MKKNQSLTLLLPLLCALFLLVGGFVGCSKSNTSQPWSFLSYPGPGVPHKEKINYCRGCGTSDLNSHGCVGTSCINIVGCMVDQDIFDSTVNDPPKWENDKEKMYYIRDSFLINFELGQWYITYYYELSAVAIENGMINLTNCLEYYNFAMDLIDVVEKIKTGAASVVPIDDALKARAEDFIARFRATTDNEIVLGYLDNIRNDLDRFTGKNVDYIRTAITTE